MKKVIASAAVAILLATSPVAFAQDAAGSTATPPAQDSLHNRVDRNLSKLENKLGASSSDAKDIRHTLARLTDNALSEEGFDNVRMRLVDADRNRIAKLDLSDAQEDNYENKVEAFQKAWKAKYNERFNAQGNDGYLSAVVVEEGEFGRDAQLASEVKKNSENAATTDDKNADGNRKGDENLDDGRNIAIVTLPGMAGKDAIRVPMIHELPDSWKVNVPDRVTGETLYANLDKTFTKLMEKQAEWPADKNQAYQLVTYKIAKAVLDCENDPAKSNSAMPASDTQRPAVTDPNGR